MEQPEDYDNNSRFNPNEKLYFLHPFDLQWIMRTRGVRFNEMEHCYKSDNFYKGSHLLLTIGLKELNAYLILC